MSAGLQVTVALLCVSASFWLILDALMSLADWLLGDEDDDEGGGEDPGPVYPRGHPRAGHRVPPKPTAARR